MMIIVMLTLAVAITLPMAIVLKPAPGNAEKARLVKKDLFRLLGDDVPLNDKTTPQGKAVKFIVNRDAILKFPSNSPEQDERLLQRYAAIVFYYSMEGDLWDDPCIFLRETWSECDWNCPIANQGLKDVGGDGRQGLFCGDDGRINLVEFVDHGLGGNIPTEIALWPRTRIFYLENGDVYGKIPSEIGLLNELQEFYVLNNALSGQLPATMWNLSSLRTLDLSGNSLFGALPEEVSQMSSLQYMYLSRNYFDGELPDGLKSLSTMGMLITSHLLSL